MVRTNRTYTISHTGNYMVEVTNEHGCSSKSETFHAIHTSIQLVENKLFECKIYPNPNDGKFYVEIISIINAPIKLVLSSMNGDMLLQKTIEDSMEKQTVVINGLGLAKGVYVLQISQKGQTAKRKIIVK